MTNDLQKLLEDAEEDIIENDKKTHHNNSGREIEDYILYFEINESDNYLVSTIKNYINSKQINKMQVYNTIGRTDGYNLIYSLKKGSLSWSRVEVWCNILGVEPRIEFK